MTLADAVAPLTGIDETIKALTDAFAGHNIALAVTAGVLTLGLIALKVFGKSVPFVDGGVDFILTFVTKLTAKKADPTPAPGVAAVVEVKPDVPVPPAPPEEAKTGLENVVNIKKDS